MSKLFYTHPAFLLLLSSIILWYFRSRNEPLFKFSSIILPILALVKFCQFKTYGVIDVSGFKLIPIVYNEYNSLIGIFLLICHIFTTIYALSNKHYNEIIWANIYCGASLFALLTDDFISLFAALELMMIASSSIIFLGGHGNSKTTAMRYVIMHLTAGICILSGVILVTNSGVAREIHVLSLEVGESIFDKNNIGNLLILIGLLMNVGAPPFSAWITDAYPQARTSGTVYLSLYTTKVAAYYILILFPGWQILSQFGWVMALYGAVYAILENNLRRIICYLSIFQLGLVLISIGLGTRESLIAAKLLITSHIIYNTLLLIITGTFIDYNNIDKSTEISEVRVNMKPLILGGFTALISLMSFPYSGPFFAKSILGENIYNYNGLLYLLYLAVTTIIVVSVPWKQLLTATYTNKKEISKTATYSIYSLSFFCLLSGIINIVLLKHDKVVINFHTSLVANQLLLNFAALILAILFINKEHKTRNLLLTFDYFYRKLPWNKIKDTRIQENPEIKKIIKDVSFSSGVYIRKISDKLMVLSLSTLIVTFGLAVIITYLIRL
jgi:multicomponent Na+:H+ antiporter subunit D